MFSCIEECEIQKSQLAVVSIKHCRLGHTHTDSSMWQIEYFITLQIDQVK